MPSMLQAMTSTIETANKRKSRSEFRCGFLFEEPGGFKGGSPVSSSSVVRVPKTRVCVKSKAESADDGGGCMSAPNGPIDTPDPTTTKPNRQLDGGEEKQQTHGGLLGTKLED